MTIIYELDNHKVVIERDDDPINPREWDNLGTMVCAHDRYNLGDEKAERLARYRDWDSYYIGVILESPSIVATVALPLYLYDHSGITMSTSPFTSRWDSGQVGWIYAYESDFKDIPDVYVDGQFDLDKARDILKSEVTVYDQYLRGDVYSYTLEKKEVCACCNHARYTTINSCGGIFAESEADSITYVKDDLCEEYKAILAPENIVYED